MTADRPEGTGMPTLREALQSAARALAAAGVETPQLDAELLLAHLLGRNRTFVVAHLPDRLQPLESDQYAALVARRASREPLPYILGTWEFLGLPFHVSPAVLIPRPETEVLVESAAQRLRPGARVLDVGAGSGCIGIGLARMLGDVQIDAIEPCSEAADLAERNAAALGVMERVRLIRGRFPEAAADLGPFDAVVSNPPYIPTAEIAGLEPELRQYEPRLALDGGPDGMEILRALASEAGALLAPSGFLAVEVARGQAGPVAELLVQAGRWQAPTVVPDLAGTPRVVLARRC